MYIYFYKQIPHQEYESICPRFTRSVKDSFFSRLLTEDPDEICFVSKGLCTQNLYECNRGK